MFIQDPNSELKKAYANNDVAWLRAFGHHPQSMSYINHHPFLLEAMTDMVRQCFLKHQNDWIEVFCHPLPQTPSSFIHGCSLVDLTTTCATRSTQEREIRFKEEHVSVSPSSRLDPASLPPDSQHQSPDLEAGYFESLLRYLSTTDPHPFTRSLGTLALRRLIHHSEGGFHQWMKTPHPHRLKSRGSLPVLLKMLREGEYGTVPKEVSEDWKRFQKDAHPEEVVDAMVELSAVLQHNSHYSKTAQWVLHHMEELLEGQSAEWFKGADAYQRLLSNEKQTLLFSSIPFWSAIMDQKLLWEAIQVHTLEQDSSSGRLL